MGVSENAVRDRLLGGRRTLLDLGTRNRLIHMPLQGSSTRLVEVAGEAPSDFYRALVDGRSLAFAAARPPQEEIAEAAETEGTVAGPQPGSAPAIGRQRRMRLQTRLDPEKLQRRLLDLWYEARVLEEEQGVNILFLALGVLNWFEDDKSEERRRAPLVLLPVKLERSSAAERFSLRWRGEPASPNLSIQAKLATDFGIELEDFPDEDEIDVDAYLAGVAAAVSGRPRWSVDTDVAVLGFFSFAKFLMYRDLDPENWPPGAAIDAHPLVRALMAEGFPAVEPLVPEGRPVDVAVPPPALDHVLDADSSQTVAIAEAVRGRHLVVKGPPGTGKSQTITNVIAGAVLEGRTVLFVAEKMAALEVVHRRLKQVGLGPVALELHSAKANKRVLLEDLRRTWEMQARSGKGDRALLAPLGQVQEELNAHAALMHQPQSPSGLTPFQLFGRLLETAGTEGPRGVHLKDAVAWAPLDVEKRREVLAEVVMRLGSLGAPAHHLWRGVGRDAPSPSDLTELATLIQRIEVDLEGLADVRGDIEAFVPARVEVVADLDAVRRTVRAATTVPDGDRSALSSPIWRQDFSAVSDIVTLGRTLHRLRSAVDMAFRPEARELDFAHVRSVLARKGDSFWRKFSFAWRRAQSRLAAALAIEMPGDSRRRLALLDGLVAAQEARRRLRAADDTGRAAFGTRWAGEHSDWERLHAQVVWWREHRPDMDEDFLIRLAAGGRIEELNALAAVMTQSVPRLAQDLEALAGFLKLDLHRAFGVERWEDLPVAALSERLRQWRINPEALKRWTAYAECARTAEALGLGDLMDAVFNGDVGRTAVQSTFERAYCEALRDDFYARLPALKRFDGELHQRRIENFRELDKGRIALARSEVAARHFAERPSGSGGIGPLGVLNGEFAKKRNHLPIRQLLDKAGPVVQQLKPVMMMSPLSVSQFLKPGGLHFDLLVIDEASQIEPIDALGAVARARQIVVVGDERQLPPTRFFSRLAGEAEEEADDEAPSFQAADAESILDLCLARGMPHRRLNWHYRSRHPSLIAVSNREFYDGGLLVPPSPHRGGDGEGPGLRFHHLPDAAYDRGGTRTNAVEARRVVEAVMEHAQRTPHLSLGVAAFSVPQRQAILVELEARRKDRPELESFFDGHPHEPFFVKNLENVQGDERDVILISVGYGRSPAGYLAMNFGPLNADGGQRRLNVLITRAKHRCEVFSSIRGDDIVAGDRPFPLGVSALKRFLAYAETGVLEAPVADGREPDSPFEEQVAAALRRAGHDVALQVGSAGFHVDLAIADPLRPERFLLGIECDGAQYHSARTARDRDRLRQAVLQDQGWFIHRIWSTDWFMRPKEELARVEAALAEARGRWEARDAAHLSPRPAAPDEPVALAAAEAGAGPPAAVEVADQLSVPYVEAALKVPDGLEPRDAPAALFASLVLETVTAEGPVHEQEIVTRIRDAFGAARVGTKLREAVEKAVADNAGTGAITDGPFWTLPGRAVVPRNRSTVTAAGLRRPEMLPDAEVQAAMLAIVEANFGAPREALVVATARLLGFATTGGALRERLAECLDALVARGALAGDDDQLRLAVKTETAA